MAVTELTECKLLPPGFKIPTSRHVHPSIRMRQLIETEPYLFGPGVYDPFGAQLAMYYGFKAVYFSGYSFAIGHLGTTDMDMYASVEIADAARRTVSALRKFQLTMAVGDPEKGTPPKHLHIPPVVVDMDGGVLLVMAVGDRAQLAVLGAAGCDLGQIGYETALLAHRVSSALEPGARVAGQL